ncbi:cell division protein FtsA [Patescibacteria group bacterium]|nr:cell division protein FtsA [Patescibacteria group bacterium]
MNKAKIIAGIELGSSKITTLVAQVVSDQITFENSINIVGAASSESKGIKKGQIVNIEEATEAIISSVEAAERMAGYNLDRAYIAIGGAHIHSQNSHGVVAVSDPSGEISADDVSRVIEAASAISLPQSREIIHILPREFIVDGEAGAKDPLGMSGIRLEVDTHIITASNAAIKNIRKAVNEVGIEIEGLVYSGLSASEAVLSSTEKELGCVLIDIGGGTTSMAAFVEGALSYSSVIPIGAKNVTNDLAIGLRVSLESSEKIKIMLSEATKLKKPDGDEVDLTDLDLPEVRKISKKTLVEGIIKPRLNEIFSIVRMELEKENLNGRIPSGAIITGGGAETAGCLESAKRTLSLPVRIGKPQGIGGLIDDIMTPAYATVVGLIMYGTENLTNEHLTSFTKKIKLPTKGIAGKFFNFIKDLLP